MSELGEIVFVHSHCILYSGSLGKEAGSPVREKLENDNEKKRDKKLTTHGDILTFYS
jgi:hypothetical protein